MMKTKEKEKDYEKKGLFDLIRIARSLKKNVT